MSSPTSSAEEGKTPASGAQGDGGDGGMTKDPAAAPSAAGVEDGRKLVRRILSYRPIGVPPAWSRTNQMGQVAVDLGVQYGDYSSSLVCSSKYY